MDSAPPSLPHDILSFSRGLNHALPSMAHGHAERWALDLISVQRDHIPWMERFLTAQRVPRDAPWWRQALPSSLWRRVTLFAGDPAAITHVFMSSGTTNPELRSRAAYSAEGLRLMETAIVTAARRMLFPDGTATRILVIAPPPSAAPAMIMALGMDRLITHFGAEGSRFLLRPGGGDPATLAAEIAGACRDGLPLTLIGASFGFVHLLDYLAQQGAVVPLPPGSRVMDAGGFKGRSREVSREELRRGLWERLGVPPTAYVNLLGMTELSSQLYDDTLAASFAGRPPLRRKQSNPWTATVVVDPDTLHPVPPGRDGLLVHLDLANVERPCALRTDDVGRILPGGFEILGRIPGAGQQGCSLSLDELLGGAA